MENNKKIKFYICDMCNFKTCRKSHLKRHFNTDKHKNNLNNNKIINQELITDENKYLKNKIIELLEKDNTFIKNICNILINNIC